MGEAPLVLFRDGVLAGRWQKDTASTQPRLLVTCDGLSWS